MPRIIVALLVVGVLAVSVDAQVLACEVKCADTGTAMQHDQHKQMAEKHSMKHEMSPTHSAHHAQPGVPGHSGDGAAKCIKTDEVSIASSSPASFAPTAATLALVPVQHTILSIVSPSATHGFESPPARNGPLTTDLPLRI